MGFGVGAFEKSYIIFIHRFLPVKRPGVYIQIVMLLRADQESLYLFYLRVSRFFGPGLIQKINSRIVYYSMGPVYKWKKNTLY